MLCRMRALLGPGGLGLALLLSGCVVDDDVDGDGYRALEADGDDCDDGDPAVHPNAPEICDGVDNDCDGGVDDAEEVPYDGIDNDCVDGDAVDLDGDGYAADLVGGPDCDDQDPATHPGWALPDPAGWLDEPLTTDIVDGIDNDCDGSIDEGPFTVLFTPDVQAVFSGGCTANQCHHTPAGQADLALDDGEAYFRLVDVPSTQSLLVRVAPGEPMASYLWHKLNNTQVEAGGAGSSMPFDQPLLPEETRRALYVWILEGAVGP
ncbi:MAG: putative metal-binding motif-containing protein [Deltaproteobacteria bacterium]|nr:putative metal-binding motif-containing protein [Deltaproteobacteria bacterium]